jgi:hypothetical protein
MAANRLHVMPVIDPDHHLKFLHKPLLIAHVADEHLEGLIATGPLRFRSGF